MRVALYCISILWIALGTFLVIYTNGAKAFLKKLFFTENIKWMAVFPIIVGLILVAGAFYNGEMFWFAFILGLLGIIKGVSLVIIPSYRSKALLDWWFTQASDGTIRLFGLITFILGSALLSYLI
jgi:uncharacterized protein YjeT (DUF2065 family)